MNNVIINILSLKNIVKKNYYHYHYLIKMKKKKFFLTKKLMYIKYNIYLIKSIKIYFNLYI